MKKDLRLSDRAGFTMIEMILVITILWILLYVAQTSYATFQAKVRFSKIKADMDAIAQSAYNDFTSNGVWAETSFDEMPPSFTASGEMRAWPTPPCPGWYYSWEDWTSA